MANIFELSGTPAYKVQELVQKKNIIPVALPQEKSNVQVNSPEPNDEPHHKSTPAPCQLYGLMIGYPVDKTGAVISNAVLVDTVVNNPISRVIRMAVFNVINIERINEGDLVTFIRSKGRNKKWHHNFVSASSGVDPELPPTTEGKLMSVEEIKLAALAAAGNDSVVLAGLNLEELAIMASLELSGYCIKNKGVTLYLATPYGA